MGDEGDEGFKLPTSQAASALQAASSLLEWSSATITNKAKLSSFSKELRQYLQRCLPVDSSLVGSDREKIWHTFHVFRTSKDHFIIWDRFLKE